MDLQRAKDALARLPSLALFDQPSPVEPMNRLRKELGCAQRLLVKRDDAIAFGFGGNKVRKLQLVAAQALASGADTLVTTGGIQSNHCRATAAAAAKLGLSCVIVANGREQPSPTANALLDRLLGAQVEYVEKREQRAPALRAVCERLRSAGKKPYEIPLGASTPLGALGFAKAVGELLTQIEAPDVIVHSTSSGGTQAGLVAGLALHGVRSRVIGISADDPAASLAATVRGIVAGMGTSLQVDGQQFADACPVEVDDGFVGEGYGIATEASREAQQLAARSEALFVDHTYTAKAFAGLVALLRANRARDAATVLFWHTGGQVGLFA